MKKFASIVMALFMVFMLIPALPASADAYTAADIKEVQFIRKDGSRMYYLSRFSDPFDAVVYFKVPLPEGSKLTFIEGGIYNNGSEKNVDVPIQTVTENNTKYYKATFSNLKYNGEDSYFEFYLKTPSGNTYRMTKATDVLDSEYVGDSDRPSIFLDSFSIGKKEINAGETFRLDINLINLSSIRASNLKAKIITSGTDLTVAGGTTEASLGYLYYNDLKNVSFNLTAAKTLTNSIQQIQLELSYNYDGGSGEDGETSASDSKTLLLTIPVVSAENMYIQKLQTESKISVNHSSNVAFTITNQSFNDASNAVATITDISGKVYGREYIGAIEKTSSKEYSMNMEAFLKSGSYSLTLNVKYESFNGKSYTITRRFTANVTDTPVVNMVNLKVPTAFAQNEETAISFNIVNMSKDTFNTAEATVYFGDKKIGYTYIGNIAPSSSEAAVKAEIQAIFPELGNHDITIVLSYYDSDGISSEIKRTASVRGVKGGELKISSLSYPESFIANLEQEVSFKLINTGANAFYTVDISLKDEKGNIIASNYINSVESRTETEVKLGATMKKAGTQKLTLDVKYSTSGYEEKTSSQQFSVTVKTGDSLPKTPVKIQSIDIPTDATKNARVAIPFSLTNPQLTPITGVEAFLYDESGNQLDSLYVSKVDAQTSSPLELSASFSQNANNRLTLKIVYFDENSNRQEISTVFYLETKEKSAEGATEPANLKIQKIDAPAQIYTNMKTKLPFTLVNAGKGTAYNIEVYITAEDGTELAREYIGNLAAATPTTDASIEIKFTEVSFYNLTLNVSYNNYDDSTGRASKAFEQNVVQYRLTVQDINGLDWMMLDQQVQVEFSLMNSGSMVLNNTTAYLVDAEGTEYANTFIGVVEASTKKERQKLKFTPMTGVVEPGTKQLFIKITYENSDAQIFEYMSDPKDATIEQAYYPEFPVEPIEPGESMASTTADSGSGTITLIMWIAIPLLVIAGIVVTIIVVKKKKKKKDNDDDMDFFMTQMNSMQLNQEPAAPTEEKHENQTSDKK